MIPFLFACAVTPAAESIGLSPPCWTASSTHLTASVLPWYRADTTGRLVVVRIDPEAATSVLTTNTPTPLQDLLPAGDLVAINGGFYDGAGMAMGLSVSDGRPISPLRRGGGSGVLLLSEDGHRIVHRDAVGALDGVSGAVAGQRGQGACLRQGQHRPRCPERRCGHCRGRAHPRGAV